MALYARKSLPWLGIRERHGPNLLTATELEVIRGALITTGGLCHVPPSLPCSTGDTGLPPGGRHVAQAASFTFTPIDVPGAIYTEAYGINPRGQIVGPYFDSTREHGFLATPKKK